MITWARDASASRALGMSFFIYSTDIHFQVDVRTATPAIKYPTAKATIAGARDAGASQAPGMSFFYCTDAYLHIDTHTATTVPPP